MTTNQHQRTGRSTSQIFTPASSSQKEGRCSVLKALTVALASRIAVSLYRFNNNRPVMYTPSSTHTETSDDKQNRT